MDPIRFGWALLEILMPEYSPFRHGVNGHGPDSITCSMSAMPQGFRMKACTFRDVLTITEASL